MCLFLVFVFFFGFVLLLALGSQYSPLVLSTFGLIPRFINQLILFIKHSAVILHSEAVSSRY